MRIKKLDKLRDLQRENELLTLMLARAQEDFKAQRDDLEVLRKQKQGLEENLEAQRKQQQDLEAQRDDLEVLRKQKRTQSPQAQAQTSSDSSKPLEKSPFYAPFGIWLMHFSPKLFALLQFVWRLMTGVLRRPWGILLIIIVLAVLGFGVFYAEFRLLLWGGSLLAGILVAIFYIGLRVYHVPSILEKEISKLRQELDDRGKRIIFLRNRVIRLEAKVDKVSNSAQQEIKTSVRAVEAAYQQEIKASAGAVEAAYQQEIKASVRAVEAAYQQEIKASVRAVEAAFNITLMDYVDPLHKDFLYFREDTKNKISNIEKTTKKESQ